MTERSVACIGGFEVLKAIGIDVYEARDAREAEEVLKRIRRDHSLVLVAERLSEKMDLTEFRGEKTPLLIELPDEAGGTGEGRKRIAELISKASGIAMKEVK